MTRLFSKRVVGLLLIAFVLMPISASAKTIHFSSQADYQQYLIEMIDELMLELSRLQELRDKKLTEKEIFSELDERSVVTASIHQVPYNSNYFDFPFEEIYFLHNGDLINSNGSGKVRNVDMQLYDLFVAITGEDMVRDDVVEWRIFNDEETVVGAYVELVKGTDDWVVGVNSFEFDSNDDRIMRSFANLFIHEYAHILLYEEPEFESAFFENFWSDKDIQHKLRVQDTRESQRFKVTSQYYDRNKDRFVSDYATIDEGEDMAESFVSFVLEDKPDRGTLSERKIRSFYEVPTFIKARAEVRSSLKKLGLL